MTELRRDLTLFDTINLVVGTIIGSGIFLVPAEIARAVWSPGWMLAVWIIGGVLTMLGALSLAELGAAMPEAGGIYSFITRGFGRLLGFLCGWMLFTVATSGSIATLAAAFPIYLGAFVPLTPVTSKLAGIIAINRRDYGVARQRLELARVRRRDDCEIGFYLQGVLAQQREWEEAARVAAEAGACFEAEEAQLRQELEDVRAAPMADDRRARQVARREQQLASDARMRATVWFNAAAANFNLSRPAEARRFAEKVATDEQFGERARTLLEQIK